MNKEIFIQWLQERTDEEFGHMASLFADECVRRTKERKEMRRRWIDRQLRRYNQLDGAHKCIGNTVIVAISQMGPAQIGVATLAKGDTYERRTGIAVAFAKAIGETVPDYI